MQLARSSNLASMCVKMMMTVSWLAAQEGQKLQTQVVWQADQLHKELQERKQEVEQLRLSSSAAAAQRSVGDVDNDLDQVESDKAVQERAKDELLRKQSRLRLFAWPNHQEKTQSDLTAAQVVNGSLYSETSWTTSADCDH